MYQGHFLNKLMLWRKTMKKKCFKKGGSVVDFNVNAVELTTEELKTKVNGGAALTTEQQMEMARRAAKGDYSLPDVVSDKPTEEPVEKPVKKAEPIKSSNPGGCESNPVKEDENSISSDPVKAEDNSGKREESARKTETENTSTSDFSDFGMVKTEDQTWEMEIDYKKNDSMKMSVTIRTKNKDGTYDYSNGKIKTIYFDNVTNKVKEPGERSGPVSFRDYYYYPVQFPDGTWNITGTETGLDEKVYGPCAIRTDASIYLDRYNKNGTEIIGSVNDSGYLIHTGESSTTWGCLKMGSDEDLMNLFSITNTVLSSGGNAVIKVFS